MEAIPEQKRKPNPQLRKHRELRGWSRGQMAKELQTRFPEAAVTDRDIARWETGKRRPGPYYQEKLCILFGATAEQLGFLSQDASCDWGEAPAAMPLYGREADLRTLTSLVSEKACRVLAIVGMGGIGKTSLTVELAHTVQDTFDTLFWRSLVNAPPAERIIQDAIACFSYQQHTTFPDDREDLITLLIGTLRERRCLLVLDNYETILQDGTSTGVYREGYQDYGRLVKRVGETGHQSCLVLTSREKPPEVAMLEGASTQSYPLAGLSAASGQMILHDKGLQGNQAEQESLVLRYGGNPLALKLVSQFIREVFDGDITTFLEEGEVIFRDIEAVLDQQVQRLSPLERSIMYWLAIEREGTTLHHISENLVHPVNKRALQEAVQSLRRRYLIETSTPGLTLQNVVMEYMTQRLIAEVCEELQTGTLALCKSHALMQATAREYVREAQVHLIVQPIGEYLLATFGREGREAILKCILSEFRSRDTQQTSYVAGNILNLLIQLGYDLRGYDFSSLEIRQAYLQGVTLPEVNFVSSRLLNCVFTETFGGILSVTFSPDGNYLAAGTAMGEVRIWSAASGLPLRTLRRHTDWVRSMVFSPDGKILASGSYDQTVCLWDVSNGHCLSTLQGHTSRIWSVAFSPDRRTLASGSEDQTVRLWEVSSGQSLNTLRGHTGAVRSIAFNPNGRTLASGSGDQTIRLWEVSSGQSLNTLQGHTDTVWAVAFSPNGRTLASGSGDQTVRLWEVDSGRSLNTLQGHSNWVWSVAFSPDGKTLASSSNDQTVRLWETSLGQPLNTLQGHMSGVWSVAFSPDGKVLASGSIDQTIRLWEVSLGQSLNTLQGHTDIVWSVALSPDGKILASGSEDRTVRLWEVNSGKLLNTLQGHSNWVRSVAFSPDGKILASGSEDRTVRLWEVGSGICLNTLQGHSHWVWSVAFSPDGKTLASSGTDRTVRLWKVSNGQPLNTLQGHSNWVSSVVFSPDGKILASGSYDNTIRLWETSLGQSLSTLQGHTSRIRSVAFSPDGRTLASGSEDQTVRLWDVHSGQCLNTLHIHNHLISSVAFSPDGKILASSSYDQTICLWGISSGQPLSTLQGHSHWVLSAIFSPDSKILASSSYDGTINLWNNLTGVCLQTLRSDRPYERTNITQVKGLTDGQKSVLRLLGAIENKKQESYA